MPSLLSNLHPVTVHFPIAFLVLASVAGLLYLYWKPDARLLTLFWWPMLLGWVGTGIAVLTGLLAQSGLPPQAPYRPVLNWHIGTGLTLLVVYGGLLYQRWLFNSMRSHKERVRAGIMAVDLLADRRARVWITLLLLVGLGLVVASGWNGGRLVYQWGVNVRP